MLQAHAIAAPASKRRASLVTAVFLVLMAAWSGLGRAQPTPSAPAPPPLEENAVQVLPRTITYGVIAVAIDVGIGTIITGDVVTGTAMAAVGSASNWLLYQVHEMAWAQLEPADGAMQAKTATFTAANILRLFGVGMLFTQNVALTVSYIVLDGIADTGAYVVTDRIWAYVVQPLVAKLPSEHRL